MIGSLDRLLLTSLAPHIRAEFGWDIQTFTKVGVAASVAQIFGQALWGWFLDRVGLRRGMPMAAALHAAGAIFTALSAGFGSFAAFRTVARTGESANWPGAAKALAQWLPQRETGWAVAAFKLNSFFASILTPVTGISTIGEPVS